MARRPCPTGGKDAGDGSFCEACGVYSHAALVRKRPPPPPDGVPIGLEDPVGWKIKLLVGVVFALLFLSAIARRAAKLEETYQKPPRADWSAAVEAAKMARSRVDASRASSIHMQAEAMRRREAALQSEPKAPEPDLKEERRRKKRLARPGLGL